MCDVIYRSSDLDPSVSSPTARKLLAESDDATGDYPPDAFSFEDRKNGAIIFHVIGVVYMFLALAIVCDDYFGALC